MANAMKMSRDLPPVAFIVTGILLAGLIMGNDHILEKDEITTLPEFVAIYFMAMKFATLCLET